MLQHTDRGRLHSNQMPSPPGSIHQGPPPLDPSRALQKDEYPCRWANMADAEAEWSSNRLMRRPLEASEEDWEDLRPDGVDGEADRE